MGQLIIVKKEQSFASPDVSMWVVPADSLALMVVNQLMRDAPPNVPKVFKKAGTVVSFPA